MGDEAVARSASSRAGARFQLPADGTRQGRRGSGHDVFDDVAALVDESKLDGTAGRRGGPYPLEQLWEVGPVPVQTEDACGREGEDLDVIGVGRGAYRRDRERPVDERVRRIQWRTRYGQVVSPA